MLDLLSKSWKLLLVPLFAAVFFLAAFFFFYRGFYSPPPSPDLSANQFRLPSSSFSGPVEPAVSPGLARGTLLVDAAHMNDFSDQEAAALLSRVSGQGYQVDFMGSFGRLGETERLPILEEKLRQADSFLVMVPRDPYAQAEAALVERFVEKGGRLVLVADPTRPSQINSLAEDFGVTFQPDYLYNLKEYDLNFQNIFVREFQPDQITSGLREIALYTAGSVDSAGPGLALTDGEVRSSVSSAQGTRGRFAPITKGDSPNVLAIADLTFMVPPQIAILDNDKLVSNLADYLTSGQRSYALADLPFLFKEDVDILPGRGDLVKASTDLKGALAGMGVEAEIKAAEDLTRDTIFLGLYEDAEPVRQYLEATGISIGDSLHTPFTPSLELKSNSLMVLHPVQDRQIVVILAPSTTALSQVVGQIGSGNFRSGLVDDFVGVYPTS